VNSKVAYDIAMRFAERELNLPVAVRRTRAKAHSAARSRNR